MVLVLLVCRGGDPRRLLSISVIVGAFLWLFSILWVHAKTKSPKTVLEH